jgi:hypothetical protein
MEGWSSEPHILNFNWTFPTFDNNDVPSVIFIMEIFNLISDIYNMKWGIIWFLRWIPLTAAPLLIIMAVLFMVPGFWQYIASMWLSKRGRRIFNRWWVRIPPLGIGLMMLGWAVNVLSHLLSYFPLLIIGQKIADIGRSGTGQFGSAPYNDCKRKPDKIDGHDPSKCPGSNVFLNIRNAIRYPWFFGIEAMDFDSNYGNE